MVYTVQFELGNTEQPTALNMRIEGPKSLDKSTTYTTGHNSMVLYQFPSECSESGEHQEGRAAS